MSKDGVSKPEVSPGLSVPGDADGYLVYKCLVTGSEERKSKGEKPFRGVAGMKVWPSDS